MKNPQVLLCSQVVLFRGQMKPVMSFIVVNLYSLTEKIHVPQEILDRGITRHCQRQETFVSRQGALTRRLRRVFRGRRGHERGRLEDRGKHQD